MCPGGIICPATTRPDEVVVNGLAASRAGARASGNAGMVVETTAG
jgi:uncharacterized FAD-dependent dehydrogenase